MSIVFITNASLNLIVKSIRDKKLSVSRNDMINDLENDFINSDLNNNIHSFLDNITLKNIYMTKMILKDFNSFLKELDTNKNIITDFVDKQNKIYAYKTKAPSYHSNRQCEYMKRSFNNIIVPSECVENNSNNKTAKEWVNQNRDNLEKYFDQYNNMFKQIFNCNFDLEKIERKNSGNTIFDNKNLENNFNETVSKKWTQLKMCFDGEYGKVVKNTIYAPSYKIENIIKNKYNTNEYNII